MPDYDLGRAHGKIELDYDNSGIADAKDDIDDLGEKTKKAGEDIDSSSKKAQAAYKAWADAVKQLQAASERANASMAAAQARLRAEETSLNNARKASAAANQALIGAERNVASIRQYAATAARAEQQAENDLRAMKFAGIATTNQIRDAEVRLTEARNETKSAVAGVRSALEGLETAKAKATSTSSRLASAERSYQSALDRSVSAANRVRTATEALNNARARLGNQRINIDVDVDSDRLTRIVSALDGIGRATSTAASGLNTFTGRTSAMIGLVALAAPHIAALGNSLIQLAGLAPVAAGALAALAATAATLFTGFSGIADAFNEAGKAAGGAGDSAKQAAKAQRAAAEQVEAAKESLAAAEKNLQRTVEDNARATAAANRRIIDAEKQLQAAHKSAQRAIEDLTRARKAAQRQLEDYAMAVHDGALDEKEAIQAVQEAQERLQEVRDTVGSSQSDYNSATLALERQKFTLEQVRLSNKRLGEDASEAAAKGVEGSDQVVSAQQGVQDAMDRIAEAQQGVIDANENARQVQIDNQRAIEDATLAVAQASRALERAQRDAGEAGIESASGAAQAMAELSPKAREFVNAVLAQRDAWREVKFSVQDALFDGAAAAVTQLANVYLPLLKAGMTDVATSINGMAMRIKDFLLEAQTTQDVAAIFGYTADAIDNLAPGAQAFAQAMRDIATVGASFLPQLATEASNLAIKFRDWIAEARQSGQLEQWIRNGIQAMKDLFAIAVNVGSIIKSIFTGLDPSAGNFLATLREGSAALAEIMKSQPVQTFLQALGKTLAIIGGSIGAVFLEFLRVMGPLFVQMAPSIQAIATTVATQLVVGLQLLNPLLQFALTVFQALGPILIPFVATLVSLSIAIKAAQIAWAILNTTMLSNPFVAIMAAVVLLVTVIITNWTTIKEWLANTWNFIKSVAETVWNGIKDFFVGIWNFIRDTAISAWNGVRDFFVGIWNFIRDTAVSVWNGIKDFFAGLWSGIKDTVVSAWNGIKDFFGNIFTNIGNGIRTAWDNFWNTIKSGMSNIGNAVREGLEAVIRFFVDLPGNILRGLGNLGSLLLDAGKQLVMGLINGIGNLAKILVDKLLELIKGAWDGVLKFFGIKSPAREAIWAAEQIGLGLVKGFNNSRKMVGAAAEKLAAAGNVQVMGTISYGAAMAGGRLNTLEAATRVATRYRSGSAEAATVAAGGASFGNVSVTIPVKDLQEMRDVNDFFAAIEQKARAGSNK